jgi:hypothetical protein
VVAFIGGCLVGLVLAGCGAVPLGQFGATRVVETPQDPRTASLTARDLPDGFTLCPASGPIEGYLQHLQADGSPSFEITASQWAAMKRMGATAGSVQSYVQNVVDCAARLGERQGPSAISFVIRFKDANSALDGFSSGFLGLQPEPAMVVPGLVHGFQTQLTQDAWTYDQTDQAPAVFVAFWAKHQFDLFLLTERLPAADGLRAAADMNERVH